MDARRLITHNIPKKLGVEKKTETNLPSGAPEHHAQSLTTRYLLCLLFTSTRAAVEPKMFLKMSALLDPKSSHFSTGYLL